ncbi:MAG: hypothetical protein LBU87_04240 [Lactobacillales bacterium]|nr:hypothetical protein [Lactobacillales bacterium]
MRKTKKEYRDNIIPTMHLWVDHGGKDVVVSDGMPLYENGKYIGNGFWGELKKYPYDIFVQNGVHIMLQSLKDFWTRDSLLGGKESAFQKLKSNRAFMISRYLISISQRNPDGIEFGADTHKGSWNSCRMADEKVRILSINAIPRDLDKMIKECIEATRKKQANFF